MRPFAALTILTTALTASLSAPAHAEDSKFYPGTMCHGTVYESYYQTGYVNISGDSVSVPEFYVATPQYAATGAAYNNQNNADMVMVCPIVRDVVRSDGLGWNTLYINVLNTSSSRDLTCTARAFNPNDYQFGSISSNTLHKNTDWTDLPLPVLSLPSTGYMLVSCTVPRVDSNAYPSGIASYRIDE